jgi:hypothetical protein
MTHRCIIGYVSGGLILCLFQGADKELADSMDYTLRLSLRLHTFYCL